MSDDPVDLSSVLAEEYVRLRSPNDPPLPPLTGSESERLKALFSLIHKQERPRTALCISGGGIRSATFALGIIQRLAHVGLLPKFDFLSTVSGGGYIGSWLSSYARRNKLGMGGVAEELNEPPSKRDPLKPEVPPLMWLRQFSNYLTPKLGLLSGDTWAFAGSYVRNLFLNWLMFVPLLVAALAVPRLCLALLRHEHGYANAVLAVAAVSLLFATIVLASTRPVSSKEEGWLTNKRFIAFVFCPLLIAAVCIVLYWGAIYLKYVEPIPWSWVYIGFIATSFLATIWYMVRFTIASARERRSNVRHDASMGEYRGKKWIYEVLSGAAAGAVAATLCRLAAVHLFPDPLKVIELPTIEAWKQIPPQLSTASGAVFLCFGVPAVLLILFIQAAIFVGGSSHFNEEYDREWWGRAGGWVLVAAFLWVAFTALCIYGPLLIYSAPRACAAIGGASGLFSILVGRSGKTAAGASGENEKSSKSSMMTNIALALAAPLFAIAILASLSLVTSRVWMAVHSGENTISAADVEKYSHLPKQVTSDRGQAKVVNCGVGLTCPEIDAEKQHSIEHLYAVDHTSLKEGLLLVFGLFLLGWLVSCFIGVNQFSMHGLYRNRLIRAYLGASRYRRRPNAFSGFDRNDNLPMHLLRPEMFWANSFSNVGELKAKLEGSIFKASITEPTWKALADAAAKPGDNDLCLHAGEMLAGDLNAMIDKENLDPNGDATLPLSLRNRAVIERELAGFVDPLELHLRPMHVVNMTLNLVAGENLAWQERKAESFAASPIYTGAAMHSTDAGKSLGYRPTRIYGGPTGVSLGTAVAISGAAASPNMGYHSSPALSFLLTLFNVRLGWWFGNPGRAGNSTFDQRNPTSTLYPLLAEALGATSDTFPYVYLSDGGHFENLAMYEMVLRRCRYIVVSDAGGDPTFGFDDLGNAIRKIRIDLGIRIEINGTMGLYPREGKEKKGAVYCAVADIKYGDVDDGAADGKLLYLKPAFYGDREPKDVYNYAVMNATFPHQTTGDQWFSESQFESYRALGEFELREVTNKKETFASIGDLITEAESYLTRYGPKAPDVV